MSRKINYKIFILIILQILIVEISFSQTIYDTYTGFTTPTEPILPAKEIHPSLWFNDNEITYHRSKKINPDYKDIWKTISNSIGKYKNSNAANLNYNDRPKMAKYLAFDFILNGDTNSLKKSIDALLIAYDNVPRTENSADFDKPYDEIYRATWLQNYCEAYDWVYNYLNTTQNDIIRNKLIKEVLILRNNMINAARYAPRPHNHRSKPAYGIATAALTFNSDQRAKEWLKFALEQLNTVTKYQFSSDGIYREGAHYFMYSNVNCIPFLWHYFNVSGVDLFQYYKPSFEWAIKVRTSLGWMPNFEDSYVKPCPTHMVAKAYRNLYSDLNSNEPFSKILQWNWKTTKFFTNDYTGATSDVVWDIDEFLSYDNSIDTVAPNISPTIKMSGGEVIFRDKWNNAGNNRTLIFHGVPAADNHDHPDELSYFMEANNSIFSADAGYGKDGWSDSKRSWYISADAHNLLTSNGKAPSDPDINKNPFDNHFISSDFFDFSEKEAITINSNGKIKRGISFINKNYWIIYDLATSKEKIDYKLFLHSCGNLIQNQNTVNWKREQDSYGKDDILYAYYLPYSEQSVKIKDGYISLFNDEKINQYSEISLNTDTAAFMHILIPKNKTEIPPNIKNRSNNDFYCIEYDSKEFITFQKQNKTSQSGLVKTNAIFSWNSFEDINLIKLSIIDGNEYFWNNEKIVSSENNVSFAADFSSKMKIRIVFDSVKTKTKISLNLKNISDSVSSVFFNKKNIYFNKIKNELQFEIEGGGIVEILFPFLTKIKYNENQNKVLKINNLFPNPFNNDTSLGYDQNIVGTLKIDIFDINGKIVNTIVDQNKNKGHHSINWNGTDKNNKYVSSGIYFFRYHFNESLIGQTKGILIK